ncbi:MAG TPA: carboxypeptidase regulatory-like domain-containing protein [Bryobacteraceae bacterium]|nr:carboxypeptidase regulatory-like domain-containing protein [Bryobacteraceae bacterium]
MTKKPFVSSFAALLLLATVPFLSAQTTTTLYGTVTDRSGAVVPNAQVIATNVGTNLARTAQSNAEGQYRLEFMPIGSYSLEVTATGFKKFVQKGIALDVNVNARVDAILDVGTVTEEVDVTSTAPLVNTDNSQIGRTVENSEITTLPIVGRNVYSLLNLTPGVESTANSIVLGYPEQRTMINGGVDGGTGSVNYYLDGGSNMTGLRNTGNIAPNPDAVEEFRVVTNSYSAEYGRFAGGVINILTKSGTNEYHGSLFEFFRNNDLNAYTWGAISATPLHRNQYGGTFGGPIRKNKTFVFGSYSGLRQIQSSFLNNAIVPTALERTGDFSQSKVLPVDPLSGALFPGNVIPKSRLDPTAQNILNQYVPLANLPGNFWQGTIPNPYNTSEYLIKIDHSLSDRNRLTGSYYITQGHNSQSPGGNLPWSTQNFDWRQQNVNLSDTISLNANSVNQFWASYTRNFGGRLSTPQLSLGDLGSSYTIQGTPSLPQITVTGYFTLAQAISGPVAGTNYYSLRDMVSYTRGRHSIKFGGEISLNKDIQQTLLNNYGVFSFSGAKTANTKLGAAFSGNGLADFVLGAPVTMNQDAPITALDNFWTGALFLQDDYRILPRLTLNLGLRYELQTPPTDPFDRESTFELGVQSKILKGSNVPTGLLVPGDPGVTRGIVDLQKTHFSPRVGLAWDPFGDGKTSVRAGAGIFYGSISGNEWNSTSNYQPFAVREQFNTVQSLTNPYGLLPGGVSPFPYSYNPGSLQFIFPAAIYGMAPNFKWPYTYQFNFSLQRQLAKDFTVTAAYVGSLGRRLPFAEDLNYPFYNSTATTSNVNNRRPIEPGVLSNVYSVQSVMNTTYQALQITAEKRMSHHFMVKGFYTFSKDLEDVQLDNNTTNGSAEDYHNLALDRGRSDNDRRHVMVTSLIWDMDYFGKTSPVVRSIINGWELSAIVTLESGLPFNITRGSDVNLDGNNNDRVNVVGDPYLDPHRSRSDVSNAWFNTAAFAAPATGTDGNLGRNVMDAPGVRNVDLGLFRNFRFHEHYNLQARGELTNAFNLVNLSAPTGTLSSAAFGTIRTAGATRQVQLGLRLTF